MTTPPKGWHPRVLVCEGEKDKLFFQEFIRTRKLPLFSIHSAGSKDNLGQRADALRIPTKQFNNIPHLVIVGDNDDCPKERFEAI